ncbi:ArsR family transcriptional regulator [Rhodococcus wratislaviensis]|uniref:ArsR family transcriptional regulator n=3 Tax=Rhodococcus TaxID=1827 RepID=A0AB38FDE4_RHOWR|nr:MULTISPECIES: metalloregulator ArsR/SmtB family transcription factor [Rhodococcus]AII08731.1 ArsR family transcriptional regulator [Rhodococcus opacus]REE75300.1 ArsR family transcriptional regulator [Rhodococcus wratislaviensis]WAM12939.1 metalloregulator ArsR/SmtB family transcription factor [Rhodococcus sp. JS3073]SPZ39672.1 ArsR family transcriptional regulator [Rhodococcus wratislaviensis]GAF42145.1 putative ArsR family transcriptional regulator [Rhodococcus wratislaviensis NBRC 100605
MSELPDSTDLALVFKALSNPTRVRILQWLKDPGSFPPQLEPAEEVGVCLKHIQARAEVSQSTASQYMAALQSAGLVTSHRIGQWTHYRRDEDRIARLADHIRTEL